MANIEKIIILYDVVKGNTIERKSKTLFFDESEKKMNNLIDELENYHQLYYGSCKEKKLVEIDKDMTVEIFKQNHELLFGDESTFICILMGCDTTDGNGEIKGYFLFEENFINLKPAKKQ